MNIKAGNWKDLINDQPFTRKDIITLQDPNNAMKFNLSTFHHIKNNIRMEDEGKLVDFEKNYIYRLMFFYFISYRRMNEYFSETVRERNNPNAKLKTVSVETKEILAELDREYKPAKINEKDTASKQKPDKFNAVCIFHSFVYHFTGEETSDSSINYIIYK